MKALLLTVRMTRFFMGAAIPNHCPIYKGFKIQFSFSLFVRDLGLDEPEGPLARVLADREAV